MAMAARARLMMQVVVRLGRPGLQALLALAAVAAPAASKAGAPVPEAWCVVTLREEAVVAGPYVLMGDIAELEPAGACAGPEAPEEAFADRLERLAAVEVVAAPLAGSIRTLDRAYIKLRLRRAGFDPETLTFRGTEKVRVRSRTRTVAGPDVTRAAEATAASSVAELLGEAIMESPLTSVLVRATRPARDIVLAGDPSDGGIELRGTVAYPGSWIDPRGAGLRRMDVRVEVLVGGNERGRTSVAVAINAVVPVIVAGCDLKRGAVIAADQIKVVARPLASLPGGWFARVGDAVGTRTTVTIGEGDVLGSWNAGPVPVVAKGDRVVIEFQQGVVKVYAIGLALDDGVVGATVRVTSGSSGRYVRCVVRAPGSVVAQLGTQAQGRPGVTEEPVVMEEVAQAP